MIAGAGEYKGDLSLTGQRFSAVEQPIPQGRRYLNRLSILLQGLSALFNQVLKLVCISCHQCHPLRLY